MIKNQYFSQPLSKLNKFIDEKALDNPLANGFLANKKDKVGFGQLAKTLYIIGFSQSPNQCPILEIIYDK